MSDAISLIEGHKRMLLDNFCRAFQGEVNVPDDKRKVHQRSGMK